MCLMEKFVYSLSLRSVKIDNSSSQVKETLVWVIIFLYYSKNSSQHAKTSAFLRKQNVSRVF